MKILLITTKNYQNKTKKQLKQEIYKATYQHLAHKKRLMGSQQHDQAKVFHFDLQTNGVLLKYRSFYFTMQNIWGEVA